MGGEGAEWRAAAGEHTITASPRAASLQIGDQGVAYFLTYGQACLSPALPRHVQPRVLPVDITETQLDDISGAKSEACEQKENRAIPLADGGS